jgi:hypothetical protein
MDLKIRRWIAMSIIAAGLFSQISEAAEIEGVQFSERLQAGESKLRLHGTGLLRYRILIKGYVAALYLDESFDREVTPSTVLGDTPRRLEIEYFWSIPSEDFEKATIEGVSRNVQPEMLGSLRGRIDRLNDLYKDVEPGDRYAITYVPGVGTELALNGRSLGVIEGADFSSAFFGIWLGNEALDDSLRNQLLASG